MPKVSIIIPTFQRCNSVKRILTALNTQTFSPDEFEVVVSIDGSEDGTQQMIDHFSSPYQLRSIWATNSGRSGACNRGIRESDGEVLIITDDDMEPAPKFVEAHYLSHSAQTKLGVIGASPITIDDSSTQAARYIAAEFNSRLNNKMSAPGYKFEIWDFYSGNFSIRRNDIIEVSGFNESFKIYGYEDIELVLRLIKSGLKIVFNPDALCTQHYDEDFRGLAKKTINAGKTAVLLVSLHPESFGELKFREYNFPGWKWRTLRLTLIWISIFFPPATDAIVSSINYFEKSNPRMHEKLYYLAMDYFFWLGVWIAAGKDKKNKQLISKIKSYKKPQ